jgi:hypothetical protein
MKSATIFLGLVFWASPTVRAQIVVTCGEPTGNRYNMVAGEVKPQPDGFTGARPVIIVPVNPDSTVLSYSWGPAQWAADAGLPRTLDHAVIVSRTQEKITAVAVFDDPAGVVQVISLFPTKGLVLMSQHKYMQVAGGVPTAGTFYARCKFSSP